MPLWRQIDRRRRNTTAWWSVAWRPRRCDQMPRARHPWINTLRPEQNGRNLADDPTKHFQKIYCYCVWNFTELNSYGTPVDNTPALVQIMAWCLLMLGMYLSQCRPRCLTTYVGTRPQGVNTFLPRQIWLAMPNDILTINYLGYRVISCESSSAISHQQKRNEN